MTRGGGAGAQVSLPAPCLKQRTSSVWSCTAAGVSSLGASSPTNWRCSRSVAAASGRPTMTSETLDSLYVWTWLADADEPVVAGRIDRRGDRFVFSYGRSILGRRAATAELFMARASSSPFARGTQRSRICRTRPQRKTRSWPRPVISTSSPRSTSLATALLAETKLTS